MWKNVEKWMSDSFFFSGSTASKLDDKNRFVIPQSMRYWLVEGGKLEFTIALGLGGCLSIYRKSDIDAIAEQFRKKQHQAKFQKFFTLFFSTIHHTTCDKLGRVSLPPLLKKSVGIGKEIVIAGVLNKIEIWSKDVYDRHLEDLLNDKDSDVSQMIEDAFSLLDEKNESETTEPESASSSGTYRGLQKIL